MEVTRTKVCSGGLTHPATEEGLNSCVCEGASFYPKTIFEKDFDEQSALLLVSETFCFLLFLDAKSPTSLQPETLCGCVESI